MKTKIKGNGKKLNLIDNKNTIAKLMAALHKELEANHNLFRLQMNFTLKEGFEFKAIVDSEHKDEQCRMLLVQYYFDEGEKCFLPTKKRVFKTGEENDEGWWESYVAFDELKPIEKNYSREVSDDEIGE